MAESLASVRRALHEGDAEALFELSTSETKALLGREGVAAIVRENRRELREAAELLPAAHLEMKVTLRYALGDPVTMSFEDGAYRLDGALVAGMSLDTPEAAVLSLRAALERRSLKGVLRVLTTERSRALLAELEAFADASRDPLDYDVRTTDDNAVVQLPGGATVLLERESGEWRVLDVLLEPASR